MFMNERIKRYFGGVFNTIDVMIVVAIVLLPFYSIRFVPFGVPVSIIEILVVIAFACSVGKNMLSPSQLRGGRGLIIGAALMCLGVLIATIAGDDLRAGFGVLKGWFVMPILFGLVVWMRGAQQRATAKLYLGTYFVSAVSVSVIALFYYLIGELTYDGRLRGFYTSPNYLALYISPAIFFLYYLNDLRGRWRWITSGGVVIIASALYFTNSFSAWLAIGGAFVVTAFFLQRKKRVLVISVALLGLALILLQVNGQKIADLREVPERSSVASRLMIYKSAVMIGRDHIVVGITPNTFQDHYLEYQKHFPPYLEWAVPQPHNLYLAFWLQGGLLGLLGLLTVLWWFYGRMYVFIKKNASVAFLVASVTSILLYGLSDTPYWKNDLAFVFWLLIAVGAGIYSSKTSCYRSERKHVSDESTSEVHS